MPPQIGVRQLSPTEFFGYSPIPSESEGADLASRLLIDLRGWNPQPLKLLAHAHSLLRERGSLIIELDAEDGGSPGRCHEKAFYLKALAEHSGFSRHAGPIGEGAGPLQVVLAKTAAARWRLSEFAPEDLPGCLSLFKETFAGEMSPDLWHWKYGEGRGRAVIARRHGRIVAHYGATSRRIAVNGRTVRGLQVCDVMVAPGERALMTKKGVFFEVASAFLEAYFGYYDEHELAFGFPNHRAMRIAERLGLYGEVGRISEVRWTPSDQRFRVRYAAALIDVSELEDDLLAMLWSRMAADLPDAALVLRDPAYIRYRYQRHPVHRYEALLVRDRLRGRPQGVAILRRDNDEYKLLDILAPLNNIPMLIDAARIAAAHRSLSALTAWISAPYARHLVHGGGVATDTDVRIPANVWTDARSVECLKDRWWLMMGDTDFL
ncbi:GNAT family N-acetyltransferase [Methylococcus mesophilus]|uniref:GNAT family N-acetyltransferase n=1 Tax=Methylococcus mesophilus TaxID=2993564 RepID=UPI00224B7DAA|nr:GNAT family N-acetyltransferase [Methylococcus mesophilus]UZR28224.1 GNAT family N-acetyltransferase [Methylococcus mesophilus]